MENNEDAYKLVYNCSTLFVLILAGIVTVLMDGLVISKLWAWFAVPVFNLPALKFWEAAGIGVLVGYMTTHQRNKSRSTTLSEAFNDALFAIFYPLLTLGIGALVHLMI